MNSETPGSMIDRLSINAYNIYHMVGKIQREELTEEHCNKCEANEKV